MKRKMINSESLSEINKYFLQKKINKSLITSLNSNLNIKALVDSLLVSFKIVRNYLISSQKDLISLVKGIELNLLALLTHNKIVGGKKMDKFNILHGDLLMVESLNYINQINDSTIKQFFFQYNQLQNTKIFFDIFFLKKKKSIIKLLHIIYFLF